MQRSAVALGLPFTAEAGSRRHAINQMGALHSAQWHRIRGKNAWLAGEPMASKNDLGDR